jgi:23S rRNA-/tRNA-specific pseudouridylate synthase
MLARNASRIQYRLVASFLCGNSLSVRRSLATKKSAETNASTARDRALIDISKHIIYEDAQLLVVSKPPGVLSQGDLSQEDNIVDAVRRFVAFAAATKVKACV